MSGLSSLTNNALNSLNHSQFGLQQAGTRLATGKQINTAADNPSGLAIYETLTAQANAFDQGSLNVQDALNATNVAQGATQTISDILQNINVLSVQAGNDFLGGSDRASLQAAANQQIQQLNNIAATTNFNGASLTNGQFAGSTPATPATGNITSNDLLQSGPGNVVNTAAGLNVAAGAPSETFLVSVSAGQAQVNLGDSATGTTTIRGSFAAGAVVNAGGATFTLGNFGATDTGTATIQINQGTAFSAGQPATVQTGAAQGATTQLNFPSVTSNTLGVSNIDFATTGNAENALGVVGQAITALSTAQSQLGAQTNALQNQLNANNIASTNLTASASNIADANIPQTSEQFNQNQIQSQITLSVLAKANLNAGFLSALLNHAA
jgi:flagellin